MNGIDGAGNVRAGMIGAALTVSAWKATARAATKRVVAVVILTRHAAN
jgi:hypothetical protein